MAKFKLQEACNRAKEALEQGDSERAVAMCQHIVRYYPRCVEAYRLLGEAYLERGDTATADKLFSYVVQADPQNVLAHIGRAIICEERGEIDAAISEFERAFEIDPAISELREELLRLYTSRFGSEGAKLRTSRVGLAHLYARDCLFPQAINEYSDILRSEPRLDVRVALALTLWRAGNDAAAADLCNAILQQVPNNIQANLILGQIWLAQGQRDDALSLLRRAMDLDPDNALARSLFESRAGRIMLPPLTYYAAELPKWEGSELSASNELPLGLNEVVQLEEDALPPHMAEAAPAPAAAEREPQPVELTAAAVSEQLASTEREVEADVDQTPAWLLSEAPVVETPYPASDGREDGHTTTPELQRQRLDRSEFLQRLATAGLGISPTSPLADETNAGATASAEVAAPAAASSEQLDVNSADWLERLAASTRFDADASPTTGADQPRLHERGFLDELFDDAEASAPAPAEAQPGIGAEVTSPITAVEAEAAPPGIAKQTDALSAAPSPANAEEVAQPAATAAVAVHEGAIQRTSTTGPLPDLAAPPTHIPTALSATTSEEETMPAPSYAEDDEQGRTFEFDWDKEGLPDYLKEFALGESSSGGPPEQAPASQAQAGEAEALPSWLTSTQLPAASQPSPLSSDEGLPAWLTSAPAPPAAATLPSAATPPPAAPPAAAIMPPPPSVASGPGHLAGLPDWLTSAPPANQPAAPLPAATPAPPLGQQPGPDRDIDVEGLPSWLTPIPSEPPAPAQAAPPLQPAPPAATMPPTNTAADGMAGIDMEGLPAWLTSAQPLSDVPTTPPPPAPAPDDMAGLDSTALDSMDIEGLPSWLTSAQPTPADAPGQPATPSIPPPAPARFDDRGLPSWLTPESTPPPASLDESSLQPFSIPLDDQPAPPDQAAFGNLQPFNFDDVRFTPPSSQQPGAASAAPPGSLQPFSFDAAPPRDDLDELEDFVDFLKPPMPAAAVQSPMADIPADLKPFSLDDLELNPPGTPFATPPASNFDSAPRVQPFSLADTAPTPSAAAAQDYALPSSLKPFSLDDLGTPPASNTQASAPPSAAATDFGTLAPTPPVTASSTAVQSDFGIPADLKPFSFDDFDSLAGPLPEQAATNVSGAPPLPPTADLADYQLPADLRPFSFEGDTAAQREAANDFDFAPFNFDELMQEPPPQSAYPAAPLSRADLSLADTTPPRSAGRPSLLDRELGEEGNGDVRGFSWQQPAHREPTAPLVQPSAEDESISMFAKLRRRKEELEHSEPTAEPISTVPPVGAPLTAEERSDLTTMNWPMEFQDMDANPEVGTTPQSGSETAMPAVPASNIPPTYPMAEATIATAPPISEAQTAGGDEFGLSELDLSPEERAYLLGEDVPISGLEVVRHMQEDAGTGDYVDIAPPGAEMPVDVTPPAAEAKAAAPTEEEPAAPNARERWVDFLASPPHAPVEVPTQEPVAADAVTEPEFVDMYEAPAEESASAEATAAEAEVVEVDYIIIDEQTVVGGGMSNEALPVAEPAHPYVPPATPVVPPSAYVPPAPPLYMDSHPSASTAAAHSMSPSYAPMLAHDELTSISALRSFVDANGDDVTARLVLARAYENNEDYDNALEQYRLIIKSKSLPAPVLEDVVNNLQDLLSSEYLSNNPRAHRLLGDAYMKQGLFQHAISQYNWLLSK